MSVTSFTLARRGNTLFIISTLQHASDTFRQLLCSMPPLVASSLQAVPSHGMEHGSSNLHDEQDSWPKKQQNFRIMDMKKPQDQENRSTELEDWDTEHNSDVIRQHRIATSPYPYSNIKLEPSDKLLYLQENTHQYGYPAPSPSKGLAHGLGQTFPPTSGIQGPNFVSGGQRRLILEGVPSLNGQYFEVEVDTLDKIRSLASFGDAKTEKHWAV